MQSLKIHVSAYLNELSSIHAQLRFDDGDGETHGLDKTLHNVDNYLDQLACVKTSDIFDSLSSTSRMPNDETGRGEEQNELQVKLIFKINMLLNEQMECLVATLNSLESCLIAMTKHQESIMQTNDETLERLILSITTINRAYWNCFYECKSEIRGDRLQANHNVVQLRRIFENWSELRTNHLQVDLEVCNYYVKKSKEK